MNELFSRLAGAPLANVLILAALACIANAIFGAANETLAATSRFRTLSGLAGTVLLFYVYGIHSHWPTQTLFNPIRKTIQEPVPLSQRPEYAVRETVPQHAQARLQAVQQPEPQTAGSATREPAQAPTSQPSQQPTEQPATKTPPSPFAGKWKVSGPDASSDAKRRGIIFLKVDQQGDRVSVRAWGSCEGQYCDWGTGQGSIREAAANVTWNQGPVQHRMKLLPAAGTLRMVLDNAYRDHRPPEHLEEQFAKSP